MHVVPPITREFSLVENRTIGTQKSSALLPFPPIVTDVISLKPILEKSISKNFTKIYLAACFDISVDTGQSRYVFAGETRRRNAVK